MTMVVDHISWFAACRRHVIYTVIPLRVKFYIQYAFLQSTQVPCTACVFSALTLLVRHQEEHPACKNWVMRCWNGYLSGTRCKLFAYDPADATAIHKPHHLLRHLNTDWVYFSGTQVVLEKRPLNGCTSVVVLQETQLKSHSLYHRVLSL